MMQGFGGNNMWLFLIIFMMGGNCAIDCNTLLMIMLIMNCCEPKMC